ncbi:hypothetical protein SAMN05216420_104134 [Nitrosospira sp. Nl5]|nr:hypothetical protein SAMN05216420_104134 [Nitrosospira sp. Nl5]
MMTCPIDMAGDMPGAWYEPLRFAAFPFPVNSPGSCDE